MLDVYVDTVGPILFTLAMVLIQIIARVVAGLRALWWIWLAQITLFALQIGGLSAALLSLTRSPGLGDRFPFIAAVSAAMVFTPFAIAFLTGRLLGVRLGARTWRAKLLLALLFAATVSVGAGIGWWIS